MYTTTLHGAPYGRDGEAGEDAASLREIADRRDTLHGSQYMVICEDGIEIARMTRTGASGDTPEADTLDNLIHDAIADLHDNRCAE